MKKDPIIAELYPEDDRFDYTEACRAIAAIVQATKEETGAEKVSVTVRIAPDGTHVTVDPWEPYESETKAIVDLLVDKMIGRR